MLGGMWATRGEQGQLRDMREMKGAMAYVMRHTVDNSRFAEHNQKSF